MLSVTTECAEAYICGWCLFWCFFRLLGSENLSGQSKHWYGLSPVWMFLWIFRFQNCENFLPQMVQPYGLSPVCVLRWDSKFAGELKTLLQNLQTQTLFLGIFCCTSVLL